MIQLSFESLSLARFVPLFEVQSLLGFELGEIALAQT